MSKSIKIKDEDYQLLVELMRPRETFSEVIHRLMTAAVLLSKVEPLIRGQHEFLKWQEAQLREQKAAHG